ncbi:putative acetoacetyl-synthase protein [Coleophoma crateriformis]|uniref:Putative acetoacetyl-synthase protein n=1 Tax=Coleophoma crateriformis TaxID=565419 RepID=A0A3D8T8D7_9HELO|nr:putative acetoacetyl-synthase protein [Coleophoma crateriformis]
MGFMASDTPASSDLAVELWRHPNPASARMWEFKDVINQKYSLNLDSYDDLYRWSIANISDFWAETWHFTGIVASKPFDRVLESNAPMFPRPDFFAGSQLNFAENLLFPANTIIDPNSPAIISATESIRFTTTWAELRELVRKCSLALRNLGVQPHDRVAGFLGNHTNTVVAMLAATSIGAIWTGVSPDTGVGAVLDRLVQIEPIVLFADNAVEYNGRFHESITKTRDIVKELTELKAVVLFKTVASMPVSIDNFVVAKGNAWIYEDFLQSATSPSGALTFTQLPPSHPVYILYSSGTTGKPKCIIHSAAGTLIQHKKEHILHCDIRPTDKVFYFTTCTWMMWHWLISGLASGATLILYDGSPFKPNSNHSMPKLIEELRITHFGTSAKYLSILEQNNAYPIKDGIDLSTLRAIYSTGSPLAPSTFSYVYSAFPATINLGSITGGTDIISLFGAPNPLSPVYKGEIQVRGLGMAITAFDPSGQPSDAGEPGDLVCTKPFPCQPVGFFGAEGEAKYKSSYFETFPGVWHHGDFVRFNPETGGILMLGRSDGILKPSGVRFGSAEIYNILLKYFAAEIEDALCIGRRRETDPDETVVLFLKMVDGQECTEELKDAIRKEVRRDLSARHVPGVIDECFEIPVTTNGKKIEVAVKQILCGMNVKTSASVANANCLDWYREWAKMH